MINIDKELKKLYKDAMYNHLIREGLTSKQAKIKIDNVFDS